MTKQDFIDIAHHYRQQNSRHADTGIVLIWGSQAYGWKNCLRDAQHERPNAIAVDADDNVFIAQGGNDQDGAKCWVVHSLM